MLFFCWTYSWRIYKWMFAFERNRRMIRWWTPSILINVFWSCKFAFNPFAFYRMLFVVLNYKINRFLALKRYESKPSWFLRISVNHDNVIFQFSKLREIYSKIFFRCCFGESAYKQLSMRPRFTAIWVFGGLFLTKTFLLFLLLRLLWSC